MLCYWYELIAQSTTQKAFMHCTCMSVCACQNPEKVWAVRMMCAFYLYVSFPHFKCTLTSTSVCLCFKNNHSHICFNVAICILVCSCTEVWFALPRLTAVVVVTLLRENPGGDMHTHTYTLCGSGSHSLTHTHTHTHMRARAHTHTHTEAVWQIQG